MKHTKFLLAAAALALSLAWNPAMAQVPSCFDQAKSPDEVDQCGGPLLATIDMEFKRLGEKFRDNKKMQVMLKDMKKSWIRYRSRQCMFEGMAATGSNVETFKPFSLEANKAYAKCAVRTIEEMREELKKY
jgi:uncharacterized protein YecT (DUF1311 family)